MKTHRSPSLPILSMLAIAITAALSMSASRAAAVATTGQVLEPQTMDRSADPCTNFFQYANGKWLADHPIPADRSSYSTYDEIADRNLAALKALVEEVATSGTQTGASSPARMVAAYYRSGMNEASIEAAGVHPLDDELKRIAALHSPAEMPALLGHLHSIGVDALFGFNVDLDAKNATRYIPQLSQGGLGLPDRDYYLKNDARTRTIRSQYVAHVARMLGLLGETPTQAGRDAADILTLETRLAKASLSNVALRDPQRSYHLQDLAGLQKRASGTDWHAYFDSIGLATPGQFNVGQPAFFHAASTLLASVPLTQWQAYLRWHLVNATASDLSTPFVNADFDFKGRVLSGARELRPRWKRVLSTIDGAIGEALGELYVAKFFSPAAKAAASEMADNIRLAMRETIQDRPWMSAATKAQGLKKLDAVTVKIGYPDRWRDYSSLQIDDTSYLGNGLRTAQFEFRRNLAKLGQPIDRGEWSMTPPTVNAYYNPTMNEMVFPAGILQPPLFHLDADPASNYGNTGATIGHELTHGFDDEGRQFDANGNLKSWWTREDEKNFLARVKTIERQYDEITPIDKLHINGKLTAGENIADLGGLKIAFKALQAVQKAHPQPALLDDLTVDQRFFVAYAQSFRASIRPERLRLLLATDPHAPARERVLAPLANMPEFAAAFACPADRSPLRSPSKRVEIW